MDTGTAALQVDRHKEKDSIHLWFTRSINYQCNFIGFKRHSSTTRSSFLFACDTYLQSAGPGGRLDGYTLVIEVSGVIIWFS